MTSVPLLWDAYYRHTKLGDRGSATQALREIVQQEPHSTPALTTLADTLAQNGDYSDALAFYDETLSHEPDNRRALLNKGLCLSQSGDHEAALKILARLAKEHPRDVEALTAKAQIEAQLRLYEDAESSIQQAIDASDAPTPHLLISLSNIQGGLGRDNDSIESIRRALYRELELAAERWGVTHHLDSFRKNMQHLETLQEAPTQLERPLVIATLPKSGTVHMRDTLRRALDLQSVDIPDGGYFPRRLVRQGAIRRALRLGGGLIIGHWESAPENLSLFGYYTDRITVHLRDPRQALLSYAHFLPGVLKELDPPTAAIYKLPSRYLELSLTQQLDWLVGHYMPLMIEWIEGWLQAADQQAQGLQIKITTFEQLRANPQKFYSDLLAFYGHTSPSEDFILGAQKGTHNYRSGLVEEWRSVFSDSQASAATSLIPKTWFSRFDWRH